MPYVKRDEGGNILAVSESAIAGFEEQVAADDQQLAGFMHKMGGNNGLAGADLGFIRVLEDLIELLINKNTITFTELPAAAQEKMLERQHLRDSMQSRLNLLEDEGEGFINL